MPVFDTPVPISVTVEIAVGEVRVIASDRADTTVDVRPTDSTRRSDVRAAEQTRVEYVDGRLLVKAPRGGWRNFSPLGGRESIDVEIGLPAGSQLRGGAAVAKLECTGRLGECNFKTSAGDLRVAEAGPVDLKSAVGDVIVERASGHALIATSSGAVRVGRVEGTAVVKNSNGGTRIGAITGDLRISSANGRIEVDEAGAAVVAKTANGDIRLNDVAQGSVVAQTARGKVEIGIHDGVTAWLDLDTSFGKVRTELDAAERPESGADALKVSARTAFGDITIRRSPARDAQTNDV